MIFNIISGKPKVATLTVTTTPSATVTVTQSPYSLSATANSSGVATFSLPKSGTWTVTAAKGTASKSTTVSCTAYNQSLTATLMLELYILTNGELQLTMKSWLGDGCSINKVSGYDYYSISVGSSVAYSAIYWWPDTTIDMSAYSTINIEYQYGNGNFSFYQFDDLSSGAPASMTKINTIPSGVTSWATRQIDMSSVTGTHKMCIYSGTTNAFIYVRNWWLS